MLHSLLIGVPDLATVLNETLCILFIHKEQRVTLH
jgi:hypothetical protein